MLKASERRGEGRTDSARSLTQAREARIEWRIRKREAAFASQASDNQLPAIHIETLVPLSCT